ncbi:hypothetical protein NPIL_182591 [Nephila pilipes]|uniref:Uncharacterized protein n=1 Tax=Nephila pilipes TaxID=299642 RepID=A0A8X6QR74_NEPPI|nr:hypothetical protein NPIL_182591 [Nephila pilipes]
MLESASLIQMAEVTSNISTQPEYGRHERPATQIIGSEHKKMMSPKGDKETLMKNSGGKKGGGRNNLSFATPPTPEGPQLFSQLTGFVNEFHIRMMLCHQLSEFSTKDLLDTEVAEESLRRGRAGTKSKHL